MNAPVPGSHDTYVYLEGVKASDLKPFEIIIGTDRKAMKVVYFSMITLFILSAIAFVIGYIFYDDYVEVMYTIQGNPRDVGWPAPLRNWGFIMMIAIPLCLSPIVFATDRKQPPLALNPDGLFVNQQLFKACLIRWDEIKRMGWEEADDGTTTLSVWLKDPRAVINRQPIFARPLLRQSYAKSFEGAPLAPLTFENRFQKGDFKGLYQSAQAYLQVPPKA